MIRRQKKIKNLLAALLGLLWLVGVWVGYQNIYGTSNQDASLETITIGYQKGDIFHLAKIEGTLEESLEAKGYKVKWKSFTDGSALLEALATGSVDYGRTGNTPPVVSQSSGSDVVYIASSFSKYEGSAILTPSGSSIDSLEDLAGKRIAVSKGSSAHYFLIKALESVGLTTDDVTIEYLNPSAGRIAFENNNVDAWVVWDPYTASAQIEASAEILTTAEGFSTDRDFILSTESFASSHEDVTTTLIESMSYALNWVNENKSEVAEKLAKTLDIDQSIIEVMVNRRTYGMDELTDEIMSEQQDIADTFLAGGFIEKQIDVNDAVYQSDN